MELQDWLPCHPPGKVDSIPNRIQYRAQTVPAQVAVQMLKISLVLAQEDTQVEGNDLDSSMFQEFEAIWE
jgi:hypothetical protein